jgi:hypothetical protein
MHYISMYSVWFCDILECVKQKSRSGGGGSYRNTNAYATHSTLKRVPTLPRWRQIAVTVWQIPDTVDTVAFAPNDEWKYQPKHVEQFPDINKLCNVASSWIYIGILLGAHSILHISYKCLHKQLIRSTTLCYKCLHKQHIKSTTLCYKCLHKQHIKSTTLCYKRLHKQHIRSTMLCYICLHK